ncbi:MAG: hypothetical protein H5U29_07935 [Pusillimonas sp.]|nr:hypothetical protein [Pusillimonas sp.]
MFVNGWLTLKVGSVTTEDDVLLWGPAVMLKPAFNKIPDTLKTLSRWVTWSGSKVPFDPTMPCRPASVKDPSTWGAYEVAKKAYENGGRNGVGIVLNGDGLVGVDLDDCVNDWEPTPGAVALLNHVGVQYVEFSPSGRGLHGYGFACAPQRCKGLWEGVRVELYSTGRYLTVTGHVWRDGPIVELPGFVSLSKALVPTEENRRLQKISEGDLSHPQCSSVGIPDNLVPKREGERNEKLFGLARYLKGTIPTAQLPDLRPIVQAWHRKALPVIGTKDFATTWVDFSRGWEKVRCPFGETLTVALKGFEGDDVPTRVELLGYGPKAISLVKICRRLALHHEPEPFFISARQAATLLGIHFTDASKFLSAFVLDGVIELVERGMGKRASRYRWKLE